MLTLGIAAADRRYRLERLRAVRRLLDRYEELWRGRIGRMAELISDPKETGQ
jgi:hypothetical protein